MLIHLQCTLSVVVWARFAVISTRPTSVNEYFFLVNDLLRLPYAVLSFHSISVESSGALQLIMPGKIVTLNIGWVDLLTSLTLYYLLCACAKLIFDSLLLKFDPS